MFNYRGQDFFLKSKFFNSFLPFDLDFPPKRLIFFLNSPKTPKISEKKECQPCQKEPHVVLPYLL